MAATKEAASAPPVFAAPMDLRSGIGRFPRRRQIFRGDARFKLWQWL